MSILPILPLELFAGILCYLPSADLARVCCVSRDVHAVAQRVLYTSPTLRNTRQVQVPALRAFLRTVLSPGGHILAAHVRSLSVLWNNLQYETEATAQYLSDRALIAAAASNVQLHHSAQGQGGDVMLLLHLFPRLHYLELGPPYDCDALGTLLDTPHPTLLQHLREFRHHPASTSGMIPITTFLGLLRLPLLRTIDIRISYQSSTLPDSSTAAAGTSRITSLRLRDSSLSASALQAILLIPVALTHFSFSPLSALSDSAFPLDAVKPTLRYLHIDFAGVVLFSIRCNTEGPMIGCLRDWPALRTLRCSLRGLLGREPHTGCVGLAGLLPRGLRALQILDDAYWTGKDKLGKVVEMLREKEAMLPRLVRLEISVGESEHVLRDACESVGVVLVVRQAGGAVCMSLVVPVHVVRGRRRTA